MKTLIMAITIIAIGYTSKSFAQDESVQGAWNFIDKGRANQYMAANDALDTLGDSRSVYVDCVISLMEESYENFDAFLEDEHGSEFLLGQCLMALLPADVIYNMYGGNIWSETDIEAYWSYADLVRTELDDDSPELDLIFSCHLNKLQQTFENFEIAVENENEFIELFESCVYSIVGED